MSSAINVKQFGEKALLIAWEQAIKPEILHAILRFKKMLESEFNYQVEIIAIYHSVTLIFPKAIEDFEKLKKQIVTLYENSKSQNERLTAKKWLLPVCYHSQFGWDLEEIAKNKQCTVDDIISIHSSAEYTVYGIGFLPGFLYLGGLDERIHFPRRNSPRTEIAKGAVGIGGNQTGIYPQKSPGGWQIIGNCPVNLFNPAEVSPCFATLGDQIQFHPVSLEEFDQISSEISRNKYINQSHEIAL